MAPPILFLDDIHLNFGGTALLEGAELSIEAGDRLALVGRNGSGKSTLLRIIAGQLEADRGERFVQPGTTMRYLPQEPDLSSFATIADYVRAGLAPGDDPHQVTLLLEALGLDPDGPTTTLSGGEARRAALARTLAPQPDILLLDEPTNHLDLPAIEWLEEHLGRCRQAMVIISHDRRFVQTLSQKTVWLDRGRARPLNKGFAAFEDWRDEALAREDSERHKLGRKIVREEHWIRYGVTGRRRRNVRRLKELHQLKREKATERRVEPGVKLTVAEGEVSGRLVAKVIGVSKSWGDKPVVSDFSTIIRRGDRVGLVGANGSGKTTLANLIVGKTKPDKGTVKLGVNLDILLIDQMRESLSPDWTLKDALTDGGGDMVAVGEGRRHVMGYMRDFLFLPEQITTPIRALSGGERARLMLARGFRHPSNLLILDEPTNDLDLETLDLLQERIADYEGTVIVIAHDRDFLDRVCTCVIAAEGDGRWVEYAGGYSDMLAQRGNVPELRPSARANRPAKAKKRNEPAPPAAGKLTFAQKHALDTLPERMERLEFEIDRLKNALSDPELYAQDRKKFETWAEALAEREATLAAAEDEWLELETLREVGG